MEETKALHYESQGNTTYLVYELGENDNLDSMSLGMLTNNKIDGLAQTVFTQMDAKKNIKFNVSAKVAASQLFTGSINKKRILGVFQGISDAILSAEDYMIDPATILLELDYIFVDVSTSKTDLICLPLRGTQSGATDMRMFFRNMMFNAQFDPTENGDYVAKLLHYLNGANMFSLTDFKQLLNEMDGTSMPAPVVPAQQPAQQPAIQQPIPAQQPVAVQPTVQPRQPQQASVPSAQQASAPAAQQSAPARQQTPAPAAKQAPQMGFAVPNKAGQASAVQIGQGKGQGSGQGAQKSAVASAYGASANTATAQGGSTAPEDEISWMYLMQHYNKDNAAMYKAQQEAKKQAKKGGAKNASPVGQPKPKQLGHFQPLNTAGGAAQQPAQAVPTAQKAPAGKQPPQVGFAVPNATPVQSAPVTPTQYAPQPAQPVAAAPQQTTAYATAGAAPCAQGTAMNFGETSVLSVRPVAGETTVLVAGAQATAQVITPYLLREKNNEKIPMNKPVFRVGKERSYVDYFIGDNTAISRSHANFIQRDGAYFVMDTNSTNHTFVNGSMIETNCEMPIVEGDIVRLANENFTFQLR